MIIYNNINLLLNSIKVDRKKIKLLKNNKKHTLTYQGKEYNYRLVSDLDILKIDKKYLLSRKKGPITLFRTLRLASTLDLNGIEVIVVKSLNTPINLLIKFKDKIDMVLSYKDNLIMKKEDYYEIFKVEEINKFTKPELYIMNQIIETISDPVMLLYFLLFKEELFREIIGKTDVVGYDVTGINVRNFSIIGDSADTMFRTKEDMGIYNSFKHIDRLDNFTENPMVKSKYIKMVDEKNKLYRYKDFKITFDFRLLSDMLDNKEDIEELLSMNRYHKCHEKTFYLAAILRDKYKNIYIVAGKNKYNEKDYYFHSWIEIDDLDIVIDYTQNVVMDRENYYRVMCSKALTKTNANDYFKRIPLLNEIPNIGLFMTNYFGEEMTRDLEKNKHLFHQK